MFPLKVQRGAVRRGLGAPQAAPGFPKAGGAAGKEGGRRRASRRAGAGRRRRRPPARKQEAEEGWGRRARPPPQDAATMDGGPDPSRPREGRGAGRPDRAREAVIASRRARSSSRRLPGEPRRPAWSGTALSGAPRRRGDNGGRQSAGAARAPSPPPPPAGLTLSPPLRRKAAGAREVPPTQSALT